MPELAEVEAYRRLAAARALNRPIDAVEAPDAWYLKGGITGPALSAALADRRLVSADRRGKLLMLATSGDGPVLGLRFGMSGRLVVDGHAGIDDLWYSSNRDEAKWDRFGLRFADGGLLVMRDPRRLGGVSLDPPVERLGPDALDISLAQLRHALAGRRPRVAVVSGGKVPASKVPASKVAASKVAASAAVSDPGFELGRPELAGPSIKGRLLDQSRLAGVGNLAADEMLWRARLAPDRPAAGLSDAELRRLHRHLRTTLAQMIEHGGSHTGTLMPQRRPGGICPKDGTPLVHATIATRSTWWCPLHQR
ncbi:MAG: formamidopyrimidine-DNA glycosylase [Actinomycetota bacterium]|nr:formamidopyrimidine-DNA glycosylase [Actinomycetota bacterium]